MSKRKKPTSHRGNAAERADTRASRRTQPLTERRENDAGRAEAIRPSLEFPLEDDGGIPYESDEPDIEDMPELPPITLAEVEKVEEQIEELRRKAISIYEGLLDGLSGRRADSAPEAIANKVALLAKRIGVQLLSDDRPANLKWSSRVFVARTTDASRALLDSSVLFPRLSVRSVTSRSHDSGPSGNPRSRE